ncbi:MAG: transporter permease [Clostridia bacterium]|jgi:multiple sugar transport system permease protein/raffinose/stachyose/melibiose transport system permease protein|nr:transporter permease [Clostridia bacterium]
MKSKKFTMLILIPMIVHMLIFMIIPIFSGGLISFMDYNPLREENGFVGLEHYTAMLGDKVYLKAFANTLVFVSVTVVLNIVLSLIIATLISQLQSNKTRSFFRAIIFLPCVAPLVASSVVFRRSIFPTKSGLLNMIIQFFGGDAVNWIGDANFLMISVILFTLWADIGYNTILFTAGMDGIPQDLYHAGSIDGAGRWRKFVSITLPLLGRTFSFVSVMTLISHFQMFAQFNVIAYMGGPQNSGIVLTSYIYKVAFQNKNLSYSSAIAMSLFVLILIITLIQQKINKIDWEY